jgi:hypothetical protein
MFYYNPEGTFLLDNSLSFLVHEKDAKFRVRRRYFGLQITAPYRAEARVVPYLIEDGDLLVGNGKKARPYNQIEARLHGLHGLPHTWKATGTLDDCRIISTASALVAGELIGASQERAVFDLIWSGLRDSISMRSWAKLYFPTWADSIIRSLEKAA